MADSTGDPVVGATLAGYRIERRLGRGGMSVVYLAEDLALGRKVALKVLAPELSEDAGFRERFRLESRLAASIDHPNVIPIYEAGEAEGQLYIAMRNVEGTDLRRLIDEEGALDVARAVELVARVADGLEAANGRGLVHRDVKPSNVLIASPGEGEHVYLADFGLTKTAESEEEARERAQLSGTTDYLAPELITEAHAGSGADVYALGCVLYETLTGHVPFPRSSELETLAAHLDEPVPKPSAARPELPGALDAVVAQAMAKDPAERFASAAELAAAARATLPSTGRPRRLALLLAAVAAVLAGAALAAVLLTRSDATVPNAPIADPLPPGGVQRVDPETGKLEATIRMRANPDDVAAAAGAVWLLDSTGDVLHRIDPDTYKSVIFRKPGKANRPPQTLASESDAVFLGVWGVYGQSMVRFVASGSDDTVNDIDLHALALRSSDPGPPIHALTQVIPDRRASSTGGFTGWVVDAAEGLIRRVRGIENPALGSPIDTGGAPHVAIADNETLWVGQGTELVEVVAGRVAVRKRLPGTPVALAVSAAGVWVATVDGTLVLVTRDGTTARTIRTPGIPVDLDIANGSLWLLHRDGQLAKLDQATGEQLASERVGGNAVALSVGEGSVWVAVRGGATVERSSLPTSLHATGALPFSIAVPQCGSLSTSNDCRTGFTMSLIAGKDIPAAYIGSFSERRAPGGEVECRGRTHRGPAISDVRDAGSGVVWIDRWATLSLHFDRMVVVSEGAQGNNPICGEGTGTWIATAGPLKGERGEFTFYGPSPESILLR